MKQLVLSATLVALASSVVVAPLAADARCCGKKMDTPQAEQSQMMDDTQQMSNAGEKKGFNWFGLKKDRPEQGMEQDATMRQDRMMRPEQQQRGGMMQQPQAMEARSGQDLVQVAEQAGNFTILISALRSTGLDEALAGEGPFTVFAPTDEAFKKQFTAEELKALTQPQNRAALIEVLSYHVVPGRITSQQVTANPQLKSLEGEQLSINTQGSRVMVDEAGVVTPDIQANNGVIHVIDRVLTPSRREILENR